MAKEKNSFVIILVILLAGALLFNYSNFFSVTEFTGDFNPILTAQAPALYQYAINPEIGSSCSGINNWITEGGYKFSGESTIKVKDVEFKFKTIEVMNVERSPGNTCSVRPYKVEVYRNNVLIDTIDPTDLINRIQTQDHCGVESTSLNSRAYDTEGNVYKRDVADFAVPSATQEKIILPSGKSGVEVDFGKRVWRDGALASCRDNHAFHRYEIIYPNNIVTSQIDSVSKGESQYTFVVRLTNNLGDLKSDVSLHSTTSLGQSVQVAESKGVNLNPGVNTINITVDVDNPQKEFKITPKVILYEDISKISNLNGQAIFADSETKASSEYHQYFILKEITGQTFNVTSVSEGNQTNTNNETNTESETEEEKEPSKLFGFISNNKLPLATALLILIAIVIIGIRSGRK